MVVGEKTVAQDDSDERRTQAARRQVAELALLRAGVSIVAEQGFERFTLNDVGAAAGYSRGLPRHYFGSKEQFIARLAEQVVRDFGKAVARAERHPLGLQRLLGICRLYFDGSENSPQTTRALFAALGEAVTNSQLRHALREMDRRTVATLEANIRAGVADGDIRKDVDARAVAVLVLSQLRGAISHWLLDPSHVDLKTLRNELIGSLKRSFAP